VREKKTPQRHGPSWQTILVILGVAAIWVAPGMFLNTDGGNSGAYGSYSGPVLPLTAVSGGEGLEVKRHVDFDFSTYEGYVPSPIHEGEAAVTDTYRLTNPTQQEITVQLAYPYEGSFIGERKYTPAITVDGTAAEAALFPSLDDGNAVFRADDFEGLKKLMQETDYLAQALAPPPEWDIPVKVYHFTDITYQGDQEYPYIFLTMDFTIPEGASVWVLHFDALRTEEETVSLWFRDDLDDRDGAYLFVMNGDIENMTFGGNLGHNITQNSALTDVTCEYECYEAGFGELIWQFAWSYDYWATEKYHANPGLVTPEILYRDAMKRVEESMGQHYDGYSGAVVSVVEDAFYRNMTDSRLMYWVFDVEIPAGETVEVEAKYHQEASTDIGGPKKKREGYDMATRLGSSLDFTAQSAGITGSEFVEILRQNFGFQPEKGITEVALDLNVERYYLEVMVKEG